MDADYIENQRDQLMSRREKRWSMNSQRLAEIMAVLLRPISSDARRYFDTDLTALLEEYLTEAGLHALETDEGDEDDAVTVAPNYIELALLLQQSAAIYSRKVDFLYQHVLDFSESIHNHALDSAELQAPRSPDAGGAVGAGGAAGAGGAGRGSPGARAARGAAPGEEFERYVLPREALRGPREPAAPRPHPTLPNFFIDLEPRVIIEHQHVMRNYAGELIGLPGDFRASIEVPNRPMLVDDFEAYTVDETRARPLMSLVQLQVDMAAAASPLPASPSSPLRTSTPLPTEPVALDATDTTDATDASAEPDVTDVSAEPDATDATDALAEPDASETTAELAIPTPVKKKRKRRHSVINIDDIIEGSMKIIINKDLRQQLTETCEFSIPATWIRRVVNKRKNHILSERRRLRELAPDPRAEFPGWSDAERVGSPDSDDDGFFEQSSVGDHCDTLRADPDWAAWQAGVQARAAADEERGGLDVHALGRAVLRALPPAAPPGSGPDAPPGAGPDAPPGAGPDAPPGAGPDAPPGAGPDAQPGAGPAAPPGAGPAAHFARVLRRTARADREVSHVLLATLFLANAGNVRVLAGEPLSLDGFSLQLLSADERLYAAAAAAADDQFLR